MTDPWREEDSQKKIKNALTRADGCFPRFPHQKDKKNKDCGTEGSLWFGASQGWSFICSTKENSFRGKNYRNKIIAQT